MISLFDQLKKEAKVAIDLCKKMSKLSSLFHPLDIRPILASGDRSQVVSKVARDLGIDEFYAELSPQNKLDLIKKYQQVC